MVIIAHEVHENIVVGLLIVEERFTAGTLRDYGAESKRRSNNPSLKRPGNPVAPE
jgi:hypothetical protein